MERLTYWNEEYGCWSYRGPSGEAAKRLAAYEDAMTLERAKELAQAEKDGRLVVLPCKVGDTLYWADIYMRRQGVREYQVKEIDPTIIFEGHTYIPVARLGKDYFKTRQEAEEALRGNVDT